MKKQLAIALLEKLPTFDLEWPKPLQARWWAWLNDILEMLRAKLPSSPREE